MEPSGSHVFSQLSNVERPSSRAAIMSSTTTEDVSFELSPTKETRLHEEEDFLKELELGEKDEEVVVIRTPKTLTPRLIAMMVANTIATIGIVSLMVLSGISANNL